MSKLTYVELFAGAGGLSMGLEAAGFEAVAHAEIEPHARAVLRYRWPNVRLDGDVTQVNGADFKGVTLISGGSPCQDLSVAGRRAGLSGARSGLFYEQIRIWRESDAPYLLWENVLGALNSNKGQDFAAVLSAIVGADVHVPKDGWKRGGVAAGCDAVAAWRVLDLQHFGPPQRRVRVFIVAARTGGVDPAEVLALSEGVCGHPSPRQQSRESLATRTRGGVEGGDCLTPWDVQGKRVFSPDAIFPTLYAAAGSGQQQQSVIAFESTGGSWGVNAGDTAPPIKIGTGMEIASPPAVVTAAFGNMGMETWKPIDVTVTAAVRDHKSANNLVVGTIDFGGHGGSYNGQDAYQGRIRAEAGRPRRLTPLECERLMSWPDQWTATGVKEDGTEYALSDTARYRLCGNGVGSVCVAWFAKRLADLIVENA